ncbi:hypothetical protein GLW08_13250 [Pontibacillus yanchengensis]|uniref:Uncharacterized protein n=1 Tax=Pontibacillus yanchengensis TaxID=462910 RepID=A0ACC7VJK1_9BACI|nr:hypothetical protein [Pontibacillus yanchengensis]
MRGLLELCIKLVSFGQNNRNIFHRGGVLQMKSKKEIKKILKQTQKKNPFKIKANK